MPTILAIIAAILKLFGLGAQAAKESKDQQTGIALQQGADAKEALNEVANDIAARDALQPLRPDGLRVDGSRDPRQRD